jgi:gliding motility-associated lipoprotein GldH
MQTLHLNNKLLSLVFLLVLSTSCSKHDVFSEFKILPQNGWHKDSLASFSVPIDDAKAAYRIFVNLRNTNDYSYQNFWIFITRVSPSGIVSKDTIECYLANQRGQWLGSGVGQFREMSILYQNEMNYSEPGTYRYDIVHGMRDTLLLGISDIGLRIQKADK